MRRRLGGARRLAARRLAAAAAAGAVPAPAGAGRHGVLAQLVPSLCRRKEPPFPPCVSHSVPFPRPLRPPPGAHEPERALDAGAVLAEALPEPRQAESLQPHLRAALRLRHGKLAGFARRAGGPGWQPRQQRAGCGQW